MLETSRRRLLERLSPSDVVLDLGGWADPFERADWVIDLMPYESRGLYARNGWGPRRFEPERFSRERWIERDLCERRPYPFEDGEIDFAVCSQTLEDVRDPLWVCSELARVARAGYIEVPSRLEEQAWGVNGAFAGWSHHRWLIDVEEEAIAFTLKLHALHAHPEWCFPPGFRETLSDQERVQTLWWQGGFACRERVLLDDEQADGYLRPFVERELAGRGHPPGSKIQRSRRGTARRAIDRLLG